MLPQTRTDLKHIGYLNDMRVGILIEPDRYGSLALAAYLTPADYRSTRPLHFEHQDTGQLAFDLATEQLQTNWQPTTRHFMVAVSLVSAALGFGSAKAGYYSLLDYALAVPYAELAEFVRAVTQGYSTDRMIQLRNGAYQALRTSAANMRVARGSDTGLPLDVAQLIEALPNAPYGALLEI